MTDQNEEYAANPAQDEAVSRLQQLVPTDAVSRKRVLASLLRALNLESRN